MAPLMVNDALRTAKCDLGLRPVYRKLRLPMNHHSMWHT